MFIDREAKTPPAPFGGAEWFRGGEVLLNSAPPNGVAGWRFAVWL